MRMKMRLIGALLCAALSLALFLAPMLSAASARAEGLDELFGAFGDLFDAEDAEEKAPAGGGKVYDGPTVEVEIAGKTVEVHESFKKEMDEYAAFFDEYVEFMEDPDMVNYVTFMTRYAEAMEGLDRIGDMELSNGDLAYYTKVMSEIEVKLMLVAD